MIDLIVFIYIVGAMFTGGCAFFKIYDRKGAMVWRVFAISLAVLLWPWFLGVIWSDK